MGVDKSDRCPGKSVGGGGEKRKKRELEVGKWSLLNELNVRRRGKALLSTNGPCCKPY